MNSRVTDSLVTEAQSNRPVEPQAGGGSQATGGRHGGARHAVRRGPAWFWCERSNDNFVRSFAFDRSHTIELGGAGGCSAHSGSRSPLRQRGSFDRSLRLRRHGRTLAQEMLPSSVSLLRGDDPRRTLRFKCARERAAQVRTNELAIYAEFERERLGANGVSVRCHGLSIADERTNASERTNVHTILTVGLRSFGRLLAWVMAASGCRSVRGRAFERSKSSISTSNERFVVEGDNVCCRR